MEISAGSQCHGGYATSDTSNPCQLWPDKFVLIVWGGLGTSVFNTGERYDPSTDSIHLSSGFWPRQRSCKKL